MARKVPCRQVWEDFPAIRRLSADRTVVPLQTREYGRIDRLRAITRLLPGSLTEREGRYVL
jgi:hypothetical protein